MKLSPEPVTEAQIREALLQELAPLGTVVEEVTIRRRRGAYYDREARLDVALFGDADTLKRLDRQLEIYGRVCATVTVVTGRRYLVAVLEQAPDWVGVATLNGRLQTVRPSLPSPCRSLRDLCESLWNDEFAEEVELMKARQFQRNQPRPPQYENWSQQAREEKERALQQQAAND